MSKKLKIIINSTTQTFAEDNYINPDPLFGRARVCIKTGGSPDQVDKIGLTSDITASQYCPINIKLNNSTVKIGSYSTSFHEIQTYFTEDICSEENPYYSSGYCSSYSKGKNLVEERLVLDGYKVTIPTECHIEGAYEYLPSFVIKGSRNTVNNIVQATSSHNSSHSCTFDITGVHVTTCFFTNKIEEECPENNILATTVTYPSQQIRILSIVNLGEENYYEERSASRSHTSMDEVFNIHYLSFNETREGRITKFSTSNTANAYGYKNVNCTYSCSGNVTYKNYNYADMSYQKTKVTITDYQNNISISETTHNINV